MDGNSEEADIKIFFFEHCMLIYLLGKHLSAFVVNLGFIFVLGMVEKRKNNFDLIVLFYQQKLLRMGKMFVFSVQLNQQKERTYLLAMLF